MSLPYSNVGRTVNINKVKGLNFDKFHNDEMCKRTNDATMGRTNIRANETANNNILSLNVGTVKCGNINAELNESSEKRLHINCNNVLTDGLTITQDGNVGIGKTTPTAKLHVDGTITAGVTTVDSLITTGTITAGATTVDSLITTGTISGGATTVDSLSTTGTISGGATTVSSLTSTGGASVNSLTSSGAISGGATTVTSLTSSGAVTAGATTVDSLTTVGAVTGGVTSVTELKTNTISPATGQVNTTFPYDVYCRDMNVNEKLVTSQISPPNGTSEITINDGCSVNSSGAITSTKVTSTGEVICNSLNCARESWNGTIRFCGVNNYTNHNRIYGFQTGDSWYQHFFCRNSITFIMARLNNNTVFCQAYGPMYATSHPITSDDRLKHNEVDVTNALSTIRKLNAQKYQKTTEPKETDFNGEFPESYEEETGFIAQEVMKIPELAYCVTDGQTSAGKDIYYLNYNDIFVVNVQAVKELDAIVQEQQSKIDSLEARLTALENNN